MQDAPAIDLPAVREDGEQVRPALWISASDVFNRTPFVFAQASFQPLCSDLSQLPLAQAVSASAAVPGAFTPVNLEGLRLA